MKRLLFPALTAAVLLSACSVGPNFKTPAYTGSQDYTGDGESLTSEQHVALGQRIEGEWWTLFASTPLNETIKQAMANNYDVAAAKETLAQMNEAVRAESGALWPTASLAAEVGRQKYGAALFGPLDFTIPPFTYYEIGPAVAWTPDWSGGNRRKIERRKALAEYQQHQLDAAYVALSGHVVAQALVLAAVQAEIDAVEQIAAEDQKTLDLVNAAFQAGGGIQMDVLAAQSQLANDLALFPALRQRASVARHALAILAGKRPADWTPPNFTLGEFVLPRELPVQLPSEMVRKRPDILASEANLHAASAAIGVAVANLYPQLTLSANFLQEALTPRGLFEASSAAWASAAHLTTPLFNGGRLTAEKREAEHAYQAALAQYQQTILRAFGQVADALTALQHDAEAIAAEQKALDLAAASLDLARKSYDAGNTGVLPVEDAQRRLTVAKLGLTRAQSQRYLDTAILFVALGGTPLTK